MYKSYYKTIFFVFVSILAKAQHFTLKGGKLNDYEGRYTKQEFRISVNGLPNAADSSYGLEAVVLTLHHQRISDIKVTLEAPDGTNVWLTNRNGKEKGKHYINTRFSQFGKNGQISAANAPFSGNFVPDGRLEFVNNGQNPNGIWKVTIEDLKEGITGELDFVELIFSNKPACFIKSQQCSLANIGMCDCPNKKEDCELLPDLTIVPIFTQNQIQEYAWNHKTYPGQLRFAASIANIGYGPLEIVATQEWICGNQKVDTCQVCPDGSMSRLKVNQKIYAKKENQLFSREISAGTMYIENAPGHNHYHVDNWVEFRLVEIENGKKKLIAKGKKVSYCLYTTGSCYNNDGLCSIEGKMYGETMPNFGLGHYPTCNFDKQGISVGGFDTYGMLYEGQFIDLPKNLPSGSYWLEIEIDPNHIYTESNRKNNTFRMKYEITKQERK
ncbi:MAG: lysyl oxidase family protein [Spirosomataceae bacterium]